MLAKGELAKAIAGFSRSNQTGQAQRKRHADTIVYPEPESRTSMPGRQNSVSLENNLQSEVEGDQRNTTDVPRRLNCIDPDCPFSFATSAAMDKHLEKDHDIRIPIESEPDLPRLNCFRPDCRLTFADLVSLGEHLEKKHNEGLCSRPSAQ